MLGLKMKLNSVQQRRFQKLAPSLIRFLNFECKPRKKVATLGCLKMFYVPFVPCKIWIHVNSYSIGIYRSDYYSCLSFSILKILWNILLYYLSRMYMIYMEHKMDHSYVIFFLILFWHSCLFYFWFLNNLYFIIIDKKNTSHQVFMHTVTVF